MITEDYTIDKKRISDTIIFKSGTQNVSASAIFQWKSLKWGLNSDILPDFHAEVYLGAPISLIETIIDPPFRHYRFKDRLTGNVANVLQDLTLAPFSKVSFHSNPIYEIVRNFPDQPDTCLLWEKDFQLDDPMWQQKKDLLFSISLKLKNKCGSNLSLYCPCFAGDLVDIHLFRRDNPDFDFSIS